MGENWPSLAGVGLKPQHVRDILGSRPQIGFVEIHAENYMGPGGPPHRHLTAIRERYALSVHGVGLSLGGAWDLDPEHLDRLTELVRRYDPFLVSEHLAWSSTGSVFLNDLLPLPYTSATLERVVDHVDRVQEALRRQILLENPSTYLAFEESVLEEVHFIAEIAKRTGCRLLLDVNNVYVASINHHRPLTEYLTAFPLQSVGEVHLAGHSSRRDSNGVRLIIDSHDQPVAEPVWDLYRQVVDRIGRVPSLIERDANIPPWDDLYAEVQRAHAYMTQPSRRTELAVGC